MSAQEYMKMLTEEFHSAAVATIGNDGKPQIRIIDMMLYDEKGVYFLTAKGKEYFDISDPSHVIRDGFVIGGAEKEMSGYFIGAGCIGCKLCYSVCPQKCIDISRKPAVIEQNRCLHCGRCAQICPKQIIEKIGGQ